MAELYRDPKQRRHAYRLEDFLLHRWPAVREGSAPRPAQTAEQQRDVLMAFVRAMGGVPEGNSRD